LPRNWVSCPSPLSRRLPSSSNCWSFDKYRDRLRKLLDRHGEGTTRYQASVAKTWNITLEGLNPLARALLRFAAWFGPDAIPRDIFSVGPTILSEGLGESIEDLDLVSDRRGSGRTGALLVDPSHFRSRFGASSAPSGRAECADQGGVRSLARVGRPAF
jgi:hypothetical protein